MSMWQIWIIVAGVFFIGEIITVGFLLFWLSVSALITMLISFAIPDLIIAQMGIFVVLSGILILLTKPLADKYITKKTIPTNTYSLVGKKAKVISDINPIEGLGQVKVNGEVWSAKPETEDEIIKSGTEVEIKQIDGVKLIVTPCEFANQII